LGPALTTQSIPARLDSLQRGFDGALDGLLESVLLYDEVIVPTQDFLVVRALLTRLGEPALCELMETGAVTFVRIKRAFAFLVGDGPVVFDVRSQQDQPKPFAADLEQVTRWTCGEARGSDGLARLLASHTREVGVVPGAVES
jgi:hypothetical protein